MHTDMKEILLTNSKAVAIVDDEDYPVISRITWSLDSGGYAHNGRFRMHQLILGFPKKRQTDHANRNRLDNRKANLRVATCSLNAANSGKRIGDTGFRGVTLDRRRGKYYAQITVRGQHQYLGFFADPQEAARAYDKAARAAFGAFAFQNFPEIQC